MNLTFASRSFLSSRHVAPLAAVSIAAALFSACSSDFESCEEHRTCEPASGGSDSGGMGGRGTGASGSDHGGSGDHGGTGAAGDDSGGNAGSTSGGVGGGADTGGSAGSAGAAGNPDTATGGSDSTPGGGSGGSASGGASAAGAGAGGEGGGAIVPRCGDAIVDAGESCDDGNDDPADGCRSNCTWGPKEVIAGRYTSCAIYGDGRAKCWGHNNGGILGQRDTIADRGVTPGQLGAALPFIKIGNAIGKFTSLSLMESSACGVVKQQIWCWGVDENGQLGQGTNTLNDVLNPVLVDVGGPVKSVSVGGGFACALLVDGSVKCWGSSGSGQRGVGSVDTFGDEPGEMGSAGAKPAAVQLSAKAVQVTAGWGHTCAVLASNGVTCWGSNGSGMLGLEANRGSYGRAPDEVPPLPAKILTPAKAPAIGVGRFHVCAVLDGLLKCWGSNALGQLGLGHTAALGDDVGEMSSLPFVPVSVPLGSDPIVSVQGGYDTSCALLGSGGVKCWGAAGVDGHLGQPRFIGTMGNIGDAPDELDVLPAIDFGAGVRVRSLATGLGNRDSAGNTRVHSCVLLSTGDVKCWGSNDFGQLGLGHTNPVGLVASELGAKMKAVELD